MYFSWTQYSFTGGLSPLPAEQYAELRRFEPPDIERLILNIREERWAQFRSDNKVFLYFVYCAPVCFFLGLLPQPMGLFQLGTVWGIISGLSVGISAMSFNSALDRQCTFFRRTYELAKASISYDAYAKAHLLMIFQGLK